MCANDDDGAFASISTVTHLSITHYSAVENVKRREKKQMGFSRTNKYLFSRIYFNPFHFDNEN